MSTVTAERDRPQTGPAPTTSESEPGPGRAAASTDSAEVRFEAIRKTYGAIHVLDGVELVARPGRLTAILGPNGAGKTTLLKMLLGLARPDEGRVLVQGEEVRRSAAVRARIGYMPQSPDFPANLSGREIATLLAELRSFDGDPDEALIEDFELEDQLGKPFRTLSGGTRQKVNAWLALRFRPDVLVLDEPTAGLDPVAARVLKDRVRAERDEGRTILLTSHDLAQVHAVADDLVFLLDGTVRYQGTVDTLLAATRTWELEAAIAVLLRHPSLEIVP